MSGQGERRRWLDGQGPGGEKRDGRGGHTGDRTNLEGVTDRLPRGKATSGVAWSRS